MSIAVDDKGITHVNLDEYEEDNRYIDAQKWSKMLEEYGQVQSILLGIKTNSGYYLSVKKRKLLEKFLANLEKSNEYVS